MMMMSDNDDFNDQNDDYDGSCLNFFPKVEVKDYNYKNENEDHKKHCQRHNGPRVLPL